MRGRGRTLLATTLAGAVVAGASAASKPPRDPFPTGSAAADHAVYDALPKVRRHRAWLPKSVEMSADFPPPGLQSSPDCFAWASVYAARSYLYGKTLGHRPSVEEAMSPGYIYNRLRPPGSSCWGNGAIPLVDALNVLKSEGTVPMSRFPDNLLKCNIPAPDSLKLEAGKYRIEDYRAIDHETHGDWRTPLVLDDIKGTLARGVPVVFTMPVGQDFEYFKGGKVYVNALTKEAAGRNYHAMALVGYDEDKQAFHLMNSWGDRWADGGYAWLSYDTFKRLGSEAYALEGPSSGPPPTAASPQQVLDTEVANFQCGAVEIGHDGQQVLLSGFGGVADSIERLKAAAAAVGAEARIAFHPWPQCEAELTLAQPLATGGITLHALTETGQPRAGDPIAMNAGDKFAIATTNDPEKPYVSIIYLQKDGSAVELYRGQPARAGDGRGAVTLGAAGPAQMRFEVGPPFGDEVLIALASAQPLFGSELATFKTERQFLTALRAHLLRAPTGSVGASVLRLRTVG